jgi:hypothetical protein
VDGVRRPRSMEKSDQKEVEYMMDNKNFWIDTKLSKEEMDFLHQAISEKNKKDISSTLAGNTMKSELIIDKDNWFYETVLKKHIERLFYDDWNNYRKYHIVEKEESLPKFEMNRFWVNYQRQYEFNPLHFHSGLYSFVIFMKIPTHWKEQHEMNKDEFRARVASDFVFVWGSENMEQRGGCNGIVKENLQLSSEDEGRMVFFPAWLQHMVYPFYECEEERVTISGNIRRISSQILNLYDPNSNESKRIEVPVSVYEQKENVLKMMKNGVQQVEEELKNLKKVGEKEE